MPIPESHITELGQLLRWLYGSKSEKIEPAVKSQNPDLARLKRVIGDPRSRRVMLERQSLDEAVESTITSTDRFEKSLVDADQNLKEVQSSLDGYDGSDDVLLQISKSILDKARSISRAMDATRTAFLQDGDLNGE